MNSVLDAIALPVAPAYADALNEGIFCYENKRAREVLLDAGFFGFDDFWALPHAFVDEVNYRRGGWSGVSRLTIADGRKNHLFFVKRQENQLRYSLRHPFGRLTFEIELDAIRYVRGRRIPCVDVACWGINKSPGSSKAVLVTPAIHSQSLADIMDTTQDWQHWLPALHRCGLELYRMHAMGIRHGALYPNHLFLDPDTRAMQLIDFEGARQYRRPASAIRKDMTQLVRRLGAMPGFAREVLLEPYLSNHPKLLQSLLRELRKT